MFTYTPPHSNPPQPTRNSSNLQFQLSTPLWISILYNNLIIKTVLYPLIPIHCVRGVILITTSQYCLALLNGYIYRVSSKTLYAFLFAIFSAHNELLIFIFDSFQQAFPWLLKFARNFKDWAILDQNIVTETQNENHQIHE